VYQQYPLLTRVKNILNSVQNTEESTGKAQYKILQTAQKKGLRGPLTKYMNKFNWSALKNDTRLTAAQKKTVNKILVSLQVPVRDKFRNRPALNFNLEKFRKANGQLNIPKLNAEVRRRLPVNKPPVENTNVFYNAQQQFNKKNENKNLASQMLRQHRQTFGN
jgi:hypothetical protein